LETITKKILNVLIKPRKKNIIKRKDSSRGLTFRSRLNKNAKELEIQLTDIVSRWYNNVVLAFWTGIRAHFKLFKGSFLKEDRVMTTENSLKNKLNLANAITHLSSGLFFETVSVIFEMDWLEGSTSWFGLLVASVVRFFVHRFEVSLFWLPIWWKPPDI
jgi:hypothetical protein